MREKMTNRVSNVSNGVKEIHEVENNVFKDAIDRITTTLYKQKSKSIMISGCEPQVGVTTIALNLAIKISSSKRNVILVDVDMINKNNLRPPEEESNLGLSDYLAGKTKLADIILDTNYATLQYVSCGIANVENFTQLLSSDVFKQVVHDLNMLADIIIYDSPSINTTAAAAILAMRMDGVIIVEKFGSSTMHEVKVAKKELDNAGANLLGIILNRVPKKEYNKTYLGR